MDSTEFFGVLAVPLIIGLVEVAKGTGLSGRWAAPLALALGVGLSLVAVDEGLSVAGAVVRGLALGLSASGLYAAVDTQLRALHRQSLTAHARVSRSRGSASGRSVRGEE